MCPGSGTIRDNLGLNSRPALGDAPPAYHRPMAFDLVRTTYGPAALDALAAAVARAKGDEPLRPVTVVVPSNYAGVAARRALAHRHGVIGVGFVTLYRLAELLAGPTLARSGRVPVSSPVVATAFRAALAEDPGLFGPVADQPSTVEALRRVHRELRDLDDLQRHRLAQSDARAAAVVAIDERVTERLQTRWHDETDLMVTAAALVREGSAVVDVGPLVVHLPQQISSAAARLLRAVAAHAPVTVIAGFTGRADAPVERLLGRLDLAETTPSPAAAGLLSEPAVELTVAADEDDEVRTALRRVVEAAEAGVALERIAIVHAPRAPYGRLLSEHLTAARLPWNGITASSVAERVAGRTLLGLLDLDAAALRRRDVFALLASVPPSRRRPVAAWERQARRARVVSGRQQWDRRLAARATDQRRQADAGDDAEAWRYDEAERADELRAFVADLAERLEPPAQPTWAAYARWAGRLLELVIGGPAQQARWSPEEQRAVERVERVLDRLARLDGVADEVEGHGVDRSVFRAALDAELADGPATVGRLGEGIFVGPIPLAVGIDADLVIVLGLVEGGLPGGLGDDPLLSDRTRRTLDGALITAAERREGLHHQLLAVAGAAQRAVVASRPLADLRTGSTRYASRWLAGLAQAAPTRTVRHTSFHHGLSDGLPPASEQEAGLTDLQRTRSSGHSLDAHPLSRDDQALHRALTLMEARASDQLTTYDGNLASLAAAGVDLAPRQPVAPTALEAWARCPFSYFVRHVLGVREVDALQEELSLRPADRGVLVHAVLESVVGELIRSGDLPEPDQPWSVPALGRLVAELDARCAATEAEGEVGLTLHWQLEQRRLRRRLDGFVELDLAARGKYGVRPAATELPFGTDRPFAVALPDGRGLAMHGTIDRVDAGPHRLAVIDYKTGRARSSQADPFGGGDLRLQLPIYALAARDLLGLPDDEVVAEYWHLHDQHDRRKRLPVDVDPPTLARLSEVLAAIVDGIAAGLFAPHPDEPDPWRRARCTYCDPDGADTATLWGQWQHKRCDPVLDGYRRLVDDVDDDEADADADGAAP
jgi:ATP-dependent helicase/nuclease subunit B